MSLRVERRLIVSVVFLLFLNQQEAKVMNIEYEKIRICKKICKIEYAKKNSGSVQLSESRESVSAIVEHAGCKY